MNRSIYIYSKGDLRRKDNTLEFTSLDNEVRSIPITEILDLYIMSEMTMTTKILDLLAKYGVVVHFFDYYTHYVGSFYPRETLLAGNILTKQVQAYLDPQHRLFLAQQFVSGAADSILRNLKYYQQRTIDVQDTIEQITQMQKQIDYSRNVPELMGVEGNIHTSYYSAFNLITNRRFEFGKRVKHPAGNEMNAMISFVNSLIYTKCLSEIYRTQLNPTVSYLHEPGVRRFYLSLDITEIFKPLIGDRLIFSLINKGQIKENDFEKQLSGMYLKKSASQIVAKAMDERFQTTIKHRVLHKNVSYQYLMRLECYKLIKDITGEKAYSPFSIWW